MKDGKWRGTVQFGGFAWINTPNAATAFSAVHAKRFADKSNNLVNTDKCDICVTGAFQIINLKWFIENNGLNPSLSKNLQDIDLCLRAVSSDNKVSYYGKDLFFWHDESLTFYSENEKKNDKQMISDHVLFGKIWNDKIKNIIL